MTIYGACVRNDALSFLTQGVVMDEVWKPVPGMDGVIASSFGRVCRMPFTRKMPHGGDRVYKPEPSYGFVTKSNKNARHKYLNWISGRKNFKVHRLVCSAFHGPKPFSRAVVLHLDDDATNNVPENLRWGTQKENLNSPSFIAYCKSRTGENSPTAKFMRKKQLLKLIGAPAKS